MSVSDFGTDLNVEYDESSADINNESSDMATVTGLENLYQAVQNRLLTPIGTLPLHPNYGSRLSTLIGEGNNPLIETAVKMMVVEALQPEDRIAYIRNIDVSFVRSTGIINVIVDIVSIYSSELQVSLTVGV
ncbi:MAG: DUF2634 domain-containing protein [Candidatus Lokiarchaeota archaeon]|nr:DUF2634 domain-containing protein [Candidatus Lokiarchaeota archaeon]